MANANSGLKGDRAAGAGNPHQFRLIDLFALMTLVALLSAMAAPYLREIPTEHHGRLVITAIGQLLFTLGVFAFSTRKRKKLLEKSGKKIGSAFCGQMRWQYWPVVFSLLIMFSLASLQLCLAALVVAKSNIGFYSPHHLQLALCTGYVYARYLWRVYPNTIEFFEHGISLRGTTFIPWSNVDMRPSSFFADKIVLAYRPETESVARDTRMTQVSSDLRERVFAAAEVAKNPSNSHSAGGV